MLSTFSSSVVYSGLAGRLDFAKRRGRPAVADDLALWSRLQAWRSSGPLLSGIGKALAEGVQPNHVAADCSRFGG